MSDANTSSGAQVVRLILDREPFLEHQFAHGLWRRFHWPAHWITPAGSLDLPGVFAARCGFTVEENDPSIRIHVTADERFELYLDGQLFARGPERGDADNWFFHTYEITHLPPGEHLLTARVWAMGEAAPIAQMSAGPAFLLAAEARWGDQLSTGTAPWETMRIDGIHLRHFPKFSHDGFTGKKLRIDAEPFPFGFESDREASARWSPARKSHAATTSWPIERKSMRSLRPGLLPDMMRGLISGLTCRFAEFVGEDVDLETHRCESANVNTELMIAIQSWLDGKSPLRVEPNTRIRAVIDLNNYFCAYPKLTASGGVGAEIELGWAESLYVDPDRNEKGHRDEVEGKLFRGFADLFATDGRADRTFTTLWWQAGRYLQLHIRSSGNALTLAGFELQETRYPLGELRVPSVDDPQLATAIGMARRSIEVSTHETFMDSPYYEQLAYIGDTRLEALTLLVMTDDDRPVRKAIEMFDASRMSSGWTMSRYPSRVTQVIPTFSMLWIGMVHDFMRLRDDPVFVRARLPGVRAVIDACLLHIESKTGVLKNPPGWNFIDWSGAFEGGVPPCGIDGASASVNWQFALALRWWMELEETLGEPEMSARARRWHQSITRAADVAFWDEAAGAWAEDIGHRHFSEHAQALAILSGADADHVARAIRVLADPSPAFAPATIYFTHYVLEVLRDAGEDEAIEKRLDLWRSLAGVGLRCLPEQPEPTRSDCHGWGAHLIYHLVQQAKR